MAEKVKFQPKKFDINSINGGNRYGLEGIQPEAVNAPIEAAAYAQALATNQPNIENAGLVGTPSVSIEEVDGLPRFKFEYLKGKDGATGAKLVSQVLVGQDASGGNIYKQTFNDGTTAIFVAPKGEQGVGISEERVKELIDEEVGEIETALDRIIAIQNTLIGGGV